jgi:hypothetical protein
MSNWHCSSHRALYQEHTGAVTATACKVLNPRQTAIYTAQPTHLTNLAAAALCCAELLRQLLQLLRCCCQLLPQDGPLHVLGEQLGLQLLRCCCTAG